MARNCSADEPAKSPGGAPSAAIQHPDRDADHQHRHDDDDAPQHPDEPRPRPVGPSAVVGRPVLAPRVVGLSLHTARTPRPPRTSAGGAAGTPPTREPRHCSVVSRDPWFRRKVTP